LGKKLANDDFVLASNWEKLVFFFTSLLVTKFQNKTSFYPNFQEPTKNIEGSSIFFSLSLFCWPGHCA
jgi:hypothetical protein